MSENENYDIDITDSGASKTVSMEAGQIRKAWIYNDKSANLVKKRCICIKNRKTRTCKM